MIKLNEKYKKWLNTTLNIALIIELVALSGFILWIAIRLFVWETYSIPTYSMYPTLIPGDKIVVNKLHHGARLYKDLEFEFIEKIENPEVIRSYGFRPIKKNDIVVFNFPYGRGWDSIYMEHAKFFCKRCIATPGDTLTIENGIYKVNGEEGYGNMEEQRTLKNFVRLTNYADTNAYPINNQVGWTLINFGPMLIPAKGDSINIDREKFLVYRRMITFETSSKILWNDTLACCTKDGTPINGYRFQKDWYFMGGDAVHNSQDSRYFGPIPDDFIAGRATHIYWSQEKNSKKVKYNRILKKL